MNTHTLTKKEVTKLTNLLYDAVHEIDYNEDFDGLEILKKLENCKNIIIEDYPIKRTKLNNTHESEIVNINGKNIEVDVKLIPLIKELNKVGLITSSCCQGDGKIKTYINFELDNYFEVSLLTVGVYEPMIQIRWDIQQ